MKYNFSIHKTITDSIWFYVNIESEEYYVIGNMTSYDWTATKAQEIIDGVKSTIDTDVEYQWANEDIYLISNKHAVFFIDLMSMRGGGSKVKEKQDLDLPHEEFIAFMEDFKKFIEENS